MSTLTNNEQRVVEQLLSSDTNFDVDEVASTLEMEPAAVRGVLTSLVRKEVAVKGDDGSYTLNEPKLKEVQEAMAAEEAEKQNRARTKKDIAMEIYNSDPKMPRKEALKQLQAKAGLTKAGAATYYQNIWKGQQSGNTLRTDADSETAEENRGNVQSEDDKRLSENKDDEDGNDEAS